MPPYPLNRLSSRELHHLQLTIENLCKKDLSPQDVDLAKASMTGPYTQHLTPKEYNRLKLIIFVSNMDDFTTNDLRILRSTIGSSSAQYFPKSTHLQSTAAPPNTPFSVSGSDRLRDVMAALRARHLTERQLDELRVILTAPDSDHFSQKPLSILRQMVLKSKSNGTQDLTFSELNLLKMIMATIETQQHPELDNPQAVFQNEKSQVKKSISDKITSANVDKKTKAKVTKRYDQVYDIKPRELRRLLHIKSILMGPPDARGMISILDRLNIAIKGKEVTHAMLSELKADWNRAFRYLSALDSGLALRDPLPDRETFVVGIDQGQYNWGNLATTKAYFEGWESDF